MSHIVEIKTEVRDPAAVRAACQRMGLPIAVRGTVTMYSGKAQGLLVHLPEWRFPLVVQETTGTLKYDNYGGHWGSQVHLDRFLQAYAVEKARLEARKRGHVVMEESLADGSIRLSIRVGGGA